MLRKDLVNILINKSLLLLIILGSFPLVVVGYFIYTSGLIENLRSLKVIAWTTLIFGILLFIADRSSIKNPGRFMGRSSSGSAARETTMRALRRCQSGSWRATIGDPRTRCSLKRGALMKR